MCSSSSASYRILWPQCYFVFDFMDFDEGGNKLTEDERAHLRNRRSWVGYREVVGVAHRLDLISEHAYTHTMSLFNDDEDRAVSRAPHDRRVDAPIFVKSEFG